MVLFLILLPFAALAGLMLVTSSAVSLFVAGTIALAVVMRDVIAGRSIKMMSAGSALVLLGVGCYVTLVDPHASSMTVRVAVDVGVLAVALTSLAIRKPFTLQYGYEAVDAETAARPGFLRANYVLTWAWTGAFVLMLVANLAMVYVPGLPLWVGLVIAFAARNSAAYFTRWYPQRLRARLADTTTAA